MREGPVIYRHDMGPIEALGMVGAIGGSSTLGSNSACLLYFSYGFKDVGDDDRKYGYSVRHVIG